LHSPALLGESVHRRRQGASSEQGNKIPEERMLPASIEILTTVGQIIPTPT